jgi:DNA invertase Pin-like site-specific DNA recombinase
MNHKTNPNSKLDPETIATIRRLYSDGEHSQRKLAALFGVTRSCIWQIVNSKTWND